MFGIPAIDLIVIVAYSVLMVGIGFVAMRRVKNQEDFFLGGRRFGKFLQTFASFGQATSTENVIGTVTTTYRDGAGGIWSQLTLLWATPFYWLTAPWYRRMRLLTMGDYFRERFQSRRMAMVYSAVASFYLVAIIGVSLKAVSVTVLGITLKPQTELRLEEKAEYEKALRLEALTQSSARGQLSAAEKAEMDSLRAQKPRKEFSHLNGTALVWFIVVIVFLYAVTGGLEAAVWTDTVQSALILALSFLLLPFAMVKLADLHGAASIWETGRILHQELPGYFFSLLGSAQGADFTWYFIAVLSLMVTLNVATQANQFTANASARDELTASVGFVTGTMLKRYLTVIWGFVALICFALYSREIQNSDLVWGHATRDLLGGLGIGLVGLMIAGLLAALQSTASTLMLSSSALFTRNVYEPLVPGRTEAHYLRVGRASGVGFLVASALLCTAFATVLDMLKFLWEFNAVVAAAFWCGLKWRRATRPGAWASMVAALLLFIVLPLALPAVFPGMRTGESLMRATEQRVIDKTYPAGRRDVEERERQIAAWTGPGAAPAPLRLGEPITRHVVIAPKSIYWAQGVAEKDGRMTGQGMFNLEMYVFDQAFDLSRQPHAFNESIRYGYKILLPFVVLIAVSLLTRRDESREVERFFLRMRTKVRTDRAEDEKAVQTAYDHPEVTRAVMLFPRSHLEFHKWTKEDAIGFTLSLLAALGVVGLLYLLLNFGA